MMKKSAGIISPIVVMVLVAFMYIFTATAFCDDTDIQIDTKHITQRQYAGAAVTDGYGIEILTEEGYTQAEEIAAMREKQSEMAKAELFSDSQSMSSDEVAVKAAELGLFGSDYTAVDTQESSPSSSHNTVLAVLILIAATSAGIALALIWQKRKGANVS